MGYLRSYGTKRTPQSEPIPGSNQVVNNAGGYVWAVDDWKRLDRFLVLGSEGGTYYVGERELTRQNATGVHKCIQADGLRVVRRIVEISEGGRAAKNDPAIFALAMCAGVGDDACRRAALEALPRVCRIGTHVLHFARYAQQFRGWGTGLRTAIGNWYNAKTPEQLAYQVIKYQGRDDWTNRDLLRLSHPKPASDAHRSIYKWVCSGMVDEPAAALIEAFESAKAATTAKEVCGLIRSHKLPREAIPTQWLKEASVWEALLDDMPMTAMIRNLATMTRVGLIQPMSSAAKKIASELGNEDKLHKARIHPIAVLAAMKTYAQGHGERGQNTWNPVTSVIDALDSAFYASFKNVTPTGKRLMLALDVSGSMNSGTVSGVPGLTPRVAAAAMALVTARVESDYCLVAFSHEMVALNISPRQRLDDVVAIMDRMPFGRTDCALPMLYADRSKISVDGFIIYTDNETWYGLAMHPSQALNTYRRHSALAAKMVTVSMTATEFSIADPNDAGMLDCIGFDTATPEVISDFIS